MLNKEDRERFMAMMADIADGAFYKDGCKAKLFFKPPDLLYLADEWNEKQMTFCIRTAKCKIQAPPPPRPTWEDIKQAL
jgi:hypothetical protein